MADCLNLMVRIRYKYPVLLLLFLFWQNWGLTQTAFKELPPAQTGVSFNNQVREDSSWNVFRYLNIYNGGGVAIADFNNDDLQDIYFTGNQVSNRLYLNKGNLQFEDITQSSGTGGTEFWTTGVSIADVNGDGWLDIYVCQAGNYQSPEALKNLLYINNQDLTFTESAEKWGLADAGRSVQASFFDYNGDGKLDVYVVNHPANFNTPLDQRVAAERNPSHAESDHLYRQDNGHFTDVTEEAGVTNWAFGLSVLCSDLNNDGKPDIYVGNDYSEPDFYWINQGNGTFKSGALSSFLHISNFSMGSDIGDINNDGLQDLMVVDMMAKDNRRKKTNMSGMDEEAFWENVDLGRHYQYMQNVLQLNNGNGTFSEIAELSGMANTDWSWSPIIADFNNDGLQDVFVSNGMKKDVRDNDFSKTLIGLPLTELNANWKKLTDQMPAEKVRNFYYQNKGNLEFSDQSAASGLDHPGFSTGAAVADLDNDGDLDLVLNNVDERASIIENKLASPRSVRVFPKGKGANTFALGLKATLYTQKGIQSRELTLSRGFQSSSEPVLHFGLQADDKCEKLELTWPDGKKTVYTDFSSEGREKISYNLPAAIPSTKAEHPPLLKSCTKASGLRFTHREFFYDDYAREVLLPHTYSQNGPMLASGDANGDGRDDLFVGGAAGQTATLFLQKANGTFEVAKSQPWTAHADREDMAALFFDADGDGDQDIYVVSGSNEWEKDSPNYQDRLYINEGKGVFTDGSHRLPSLTFSGSRVRAADFDGDQDLDLLVCGRVQPGNYPYPAQSALLENKGSEFVNVTEDIAPGLAQAGMVSDACWADVDGDGDPDLMICGEWMAPTLYINQNGTFQNETANSGLENKTGWWYSLKAADMDGDGDMDFIAGNLGLNNKYRGSEAAPFEVYANDFDQNGKTDIVLGFQQDGVTYPVRGRQCSSEQVPSIKDKFPTYGEFGNASLIDIYGGGLQKALHYSANWMQSSYIENKGNGKFVVKALPNAAQISAVNGIEVHDLNEDGHPDLLLAGNMFNAEVETCRHDASVGCVLLGDGNGNFAPLPLSKSGFFAQGDVKDLIGLQSSSLGKLFVISRNNGPLKVFRQTKK